MNIYYCDIKNNLRNEKGEAIQGIWFPTGKQNDHGEEICVHWPKNTHVKGYFVLRYIADENYYFEACRKERFAILKRLVEDIKTIFWKIIDG